MHSIFIIHCSNGSPYIHWYQWLRRELKKQGYKVYIPQFPREENQTLDNWLKALFPLRDKLENAIMIGHSLGTPFIIDVLHLWDYKIYACVFVAGFTGKLVTDHNEPNVAQFAEQNYNWPKIRRMCEKFIIIHSNNDHLVPLSKGEELAYNLHAKVTLIRGGAHFQAQTGYRTFPQLLNLIHETCESN